jgi:hypothetical protein
MSLILKLILLHLLSLEEYPGIYSRNGLATKVVIEISRMAPIVATTKRSSESTLKKRFPQKYPHSR